MLERAQSTPAILAGPDVDLRRRTLVFCSRLVPRPLHGGKVAIYSEHLDSTRFPDDAHDDLVGRYLTEKYGRTPFDLVITLGPDVPRARSSTDTGRLSYAFASVARAMHVNSRRAGRSPIFISAANAQPNSGSGCERR